MHIAIVGAAGMIGRKLVETLLERPWLGDQPIDRLTIADVRPCSLASSDMDLREVIGDVSDPIVAAQVLAERPDVVFHVAATAMGQADTDFAAGYRINFDTVRSTLEATRLAGQEYRPRYVYASSIGVYGGAFPDIIDDVFLALPESSYGAQKLMSETLLADYSRRGFVDAVALRLPTIAIRPGVPTHGNSGFFSNIIREPLAGKRAELPAALDVVHWLASPQSAIGFLRHAATLPAEALVGARVLVMPGLAVSVEEEIEALRLIGGEAAVALIDRLSPPLYQPCNFPQRFTAERARALGFALLETNFAEIISFHLDEG
ncbi:NAD-dependent epimerase [Devosia pacifica]|uniref:NAD-dependent epimerase n=1 Tax=Devosia pacifica TaxID=1335967 RepID=A0A918RR60_9HYPH|nr:NAD-dependent epimerase/dehydratase family protein [Devosia pacifica]GHA10037.1 NAD-dependent epimerase [Devosia pacifica]